jgi:hypothetical protein
MNPLRNYKNFISIKTLSRLFIKLFHYTKEKPAMLKKILIIAAIIIAVITAGVLYVNMVLLPVQVKGMVIDAAQKALNRKVTFDSLEYNPINGFVLRNLAVYSDNTSNDIFMHLDYASAQVLFPALLQKKVILPSVHIDNFSAHIIRLSAAAWNFSDLLASQPAAPAATATTTPAAAPMDIIIGGLVVRNTSLTITDRAQGDEFTETITPININGSLALNGSIHLAGDIAIPATKGTIVFDVTSKIREKDIRADIQLGNIAAERYFRFVPAGIPLPVNAMNMARVKASVQIHDNDINASGNALITRIEAQPAPGVSAAGDLTLDNAVFTMNAKGISVQAAIDLKNAGIRLANGQKFQGNIKTAETHFTLNNGDWTMASDADMKELAAAITPGQNIAARSVMARLKASQTGTDIHAQGDIAIDGLDGEFEGIKVKTSFNAPGSSIDLIQGMLGINAAPTFSALNLSLPQGIGFTGTPSLTISAKVPTQGKGELTYDSAIELSNGQLKGLPTVDQISDIRGSFKVKPDEAVIRSLSLKTLGTSVTISGTVRNFAEPLLTLKASADAIDLAVCEKVIPQIMKDNALVITGKAAITADIDGKLSDLAKTGVKAVVVLSDTNIASGKLKQEVRNVGGTITYNAPELAWEKLSVGYQDKTYVLNGHLKDFTNPQVTASVKSDNLSLDAKLQKIDTTVTLESLTGTWYNSTLNADGKILLPNGSAPTINISAKVQSPISDIPKFAPQLAKQLETLKLSGDIKLNAHVQGNPADWQHLSSTVKGTIPSLKVMDYTIDAINLDAEQSNGKIQPFTLTARVYGGELNATGSVNLEKENFPFDTTVKLDGTSLALLKNDTPLKDKQITGTLAVNSALKGNASGAKALDGTADIHVSEADLKGLVVIAKVITVIPGLGDSVDITDAKCSLAIKDGKAETNNLTLSSARASLIGEGSLDIIDQTLDFNVTPRIESAQVPGDTASPQASMNLTEGLINVHIGGTIANPKVTTKVSPMNVLKKIDNNTLGGLLKLFE